MSRTRPSGTPRSTSRCSATAGIYHEGWTAVTRHSTPWLFHAELPAFDDDIWELYDTATDWTQAHDLAERSPGEAAVSSSDSS